MNKKASNNVSALDLLYVMFWTAVVMGLVYWLWPLIVGVLAIVLDFYDLVPSSGF